MIRVSTTHRPESWQPVEIPFDGELVEIRVKYRLLSKHEVAPYVRRQLCFAKAMKEENEARTFEMMLEDLDETQFAEVDAMLRERILDWDLEDADGDRGTPLPVNEQTLSAVLDQVRFWKPMFLGLIRASNGMAARKNGSTGSVGGSTTNRAA